MLNCILSPRKLIKPNLFLRIRYTVNVKQQHFLLLAPNQIGRSSKLTRQLILNLADVANFLQPLLTLAVALSLIHI